MDNRIKELILGYDLCNDYIQISCYNQKTQDMDTICYIGEKMMDRIPTVLCRLYSDRSWVCGYEAWKAVNEHRGVLVENFVDALELRWTAISIPAPNWYGFSCRKAWSF